MTFDCSDENAEHYFIKGSKRLRIRSEDIIVPGKELQTDELWRIAVNGAPIVGGRSMITFNYIDRPLVWIHFHEFIMYFAESLACVDAVREVSYSPLQIRSPVNDERDGRGFLIFNQSIDEKALAVGSDVEITALLCR